MRRFFIRRGVGGGVEVFFGMVYSPSPATKTMFDPSEDMLASRRGCWLGGCGSRLDRPHWVFNIDIHDLQMMEKRISAGQVA